MSSEERDPRIIVDEDWKGRVEAEKEALRRKEEGEAHTPKPADDPVQNPTTAEQITAEQITAEQITAEQSTRGASEHTASPQLPPATFGSLIETLSMQAMASLSEASQPVDSKEKVEGLPDPQFHIEMAKYLIDTLGVLEEKTQGNLSAQEAKQLEVVLHDLRIAYVMIRKQVG